MIRNLLALFRRESRAEYEESQAEHAVLSHPTSRVALEALLAASAEERRQQARRDHAIREWLAGEDE